MQIVSPGDNLHEMSKPIFWRKYFKLSSAEFFTQHRLALRTRLRHSDTIFPYYSKINADIAIRHKVFSEKY